MRVTQDPQLHRTMSLLALRISLSNFPSHMLQAHNHQKTAWVLNHRDEWHPQCHQEPGPDTSVPEVVVQIQQTLAHWTEVCSIVACWTCTWGRDHDIHGSKMFKGTGAPSQAGQSILATFSIDLYGVCLASWQDDACGSTCHRFGNKRRFGFEPTFG